MKQFHTVPDSGQIGSEHSLFFYYCPTHSPKPQGNAGKQKALLRSWSQKNVGLFVVI